MDVPFELLSDDMSDAVILNGMPVLRGAEICGADGEPIGHLKGVGSADMLVDRPLRRDIYVPLMAVDTISEQRVVLTIPAAQVDDMHWPAPPLLPL